MRRLCPHIYGASDGWPVLYVHGFPSCAAEVAFAAGAAARRDLQLIACDRPGYGDSPFRPVSGLRAMARLHRRALDQLDIDRCAVLGVSGGAPLACAIAACEPDRVCALALVAGLGPASGAIRRAMPAHLRWGLELARRCPAAAALTMSWARALFFARRADLALQLLLLQAPAVDRRVIAQPSTMRRLRAVAARAFARGSRAAAQDLRLFATPWDFDPADVRVPSAVWHGQCDRTVAPACGAWYARVIPAARYHPLPDDGHFSLAIGRVDPVLDWLADHSPTAPGGDAG